MSPSISTVRHKHEYTGCDIPWTIRESLLQTPLGRPVDPGLKLIEYMSSGGGLPQIGRTSEHELVSRRQRRFLVVAAIVSVAWMLAIFL